MIKSLLKNSFLALLGASLTSIFLAPKAHAFMQENLNSLSITGTNASKTKLSETSEDANKYTLQWSSGMEGSRLEDSLSNQKNQVRLGLKIKFDIDVNPYVAINLTPKFIAQTGFIQAPDAVDPNGSRTEIRNASLDLKPASFLTASVGALDQTTIHTKLMMSTRAFPAARAKVFSDPQNFTQISVYGEAAVPTGTSLTSNTNDVGPMPSLNTAGLGINLGADKSDFFWKNYINAYQFSNLSQTLANSSVLLGNTGTVLSGSSYLFKYTYQGLEAYSEMNLRIARPFMLKGFAAGVNNPQAPNGQNTGWLAGGSINYDFSKNLQIEPGFEYFRVESDATVAIYNHDFIGTNRVGYKGRLKAIMNKRVDLYFDYGQRAAILENPAQPNETYYGITVETEDAKF